jgi:acyl carrier protein
MTPEQIKSKLTGIFRDIFDDETLNLTETMTAKDVPSWDSVNHINLIVAVEKNFPPIKLTTREVAGLNNVGDLLALIGKKLS